MTHDDEREHIARMAAVLDGAGAVADKNGTLSLRRVRGSRAAAERATWGGERVVSVAIRIVEDEA